MKETAATQVMMEQKNEGERVEEDKNNRQQSHNNNITI